jgi:hypothetical protein
MDRVDSGQMVLSLLVAACTSNDEPAPLERFDPPSWFADTAGAACAPVPVAAYTGGDDGYDTASVVGHGDLLHVLLHGAEDDDAWLVVLDVSDPRAALEVGRTALPDAGYVTLGIVHGDLLLLSWSRPRENLQVVDVSDPKVPAPLGHVDLGPGDPATSLAPWGDRVFTDAGAAHAVDLSDPTSPRALEFLRAPFGTPLVVGDELLSAEGDADTGCFVSVSDPAADPPVELQRVEVSACRSRFDPGLVATDAGVVALGTYGELSAAAALVREGEPWAAADLLPLPFEPREADEVVGTGSGAFVLGDWTGVSIEQSGGSLGSAGTWKPRRGFLEGSAFAAGLVWVSFEVESGEFDGIVGLRADPCR